MFKTIVTLLRGEAATAEEAFGDRHALQILDQQIRDAAAALDRAKKALAVAIAGDRAEAAAIHAAGERIADLELRVGAAMDAGDADLARQGAEAIAGLEADRAAAEAAHRLFAAEIVRLDAHVVDAEARLARLDRGRRTARAAEAVRGLGKGRSAEAPWHRATLRDAEATLDRLQARQRHAGVADEALDALDRARNPAAVAERMASAGHGPRLAASADDVLARLQQRRRPAAPAA